MSYKNVISVGKSIDVILKYDIYGQNHWCHIKIGYICETPSLSDKKYDIYGKNNRCHIKIR